MKRSSTYVAQKAPPELRENYGFSDRAVNRIAAELGAKLVVLCEEWRKIHGEP